MEDILASIRRIIAEDQSNSLGRGGLSGLTRRAPAPAVAASSAPEPAVHAFADTPALDPEPAGAFVAEREHEAPHAIDTHAETEPAFAEYQAVEVDASLPSHEAELRHPAVPNFGHDAETAEAAPDGAVVGEEAEPLMSTAAGASITSSFQTLAQNVMLRDPGMIERVTRESLRPLLKSWLDDHLPSIVERLVRNEIERVARGGHGRDA